MDLATYRQVRCGPALPVCSRVRQLHRGAWTGAEPRASHYQVNAALAATLALLRTSKEIVRLRKGQAMRQVTPTLWLRQASCEQDEKGGSMDHLPPY
jgi:hypothetical protein